jgi:GrpB-like predicted nucleotidyltransferase (UPF0157 family)
MIKVIPYDKGWAVRFLELQRILIDALTGVQIVSIEHVGSTSVPGLAAKPIIDVDVVVSGENVVAASEALTRIGFIPRGDLGVPDRYAFFAPKNLFPTHTYVVVEGCLSLRNHIAVRDTLRSDETLRDDYGALKLRLAESADDINQYVEQKSPVLRRILAQAGMTPEELLKIEHVNRAA